MLNLMMISSGGGLDHWLPEKKKNKTNLRTATHAKSDIIVASLKAFSALPLGAFMNFSSPSSINHPRMNRKKICIYLYFSRIRSPRRPPTGKPRYAAPLIPLPQKHTSPPEKKKHTPTQAKRKPRSRCPIFRVGMYEVGGLTLTSAEGLKKLE